MHTYNLLLPLLNFHLTLLLNKPSSQPSSMLKASNSFFLLRHVCEGSLFHFSLPFVVRFTVAKFAMLHILRLSQHAFLIYC